MGLDLWMTSQVCPTCERSESTDSHHITYNLSPMWSVIFPNDKHMVDIDGMTGRNSVPRLTVALQRLMDSPDEFIPLNPSNGWGSYEGFKQYIRTLLALAHRYPNYVWESDR